MRIGLYVDVARDERPTGIGRHVLCLLDSLASLDRENTYLLYYPTSALGRTEGFQHSPPHNNFQPRPVRFPSQWTTKYPQLWWKHYLPRILRRDRIDVFHGPNHFLPRFDRQKTVLTIHDLAFFKMTVHGAGMDRIYRHWTKLALDWAGQVIALSENTLHDVLELGTQPDQVRVIYGGGNIVPEERIETHRIDELRKKLNLPERYILFVGALQPRKNVPFLVRAFARLKQENPALAHKLVLAGPKAEATSEIESIAGEEGIADQVILTGYLEDWQLPLLYKLADLFVLPTRYEGFTLVTLEAMAYGTPLIATNSSSIKEGVSDAAILVDVDAVEQLAGAMGRVLSDGLLRDDLIERGKVQAKKFTWEQCAQQTLGLYEEIHRRNTCQSGSTR